MTRRSLDPRGERGVNPFPIIARQGNAPSGKFVLQRLELTLSQLVTETTRPAVRKKRNTAIA